MTGGGALERALRHERAIVLGAVAAVTLLAGLYTVFGVGMSMSAIDMTGMARTVGAPMRMAAAPEWGAGYAGLVFAMWWIMMIAMMTPSAAPTLLLYAALKRRAGWLVWLFLAGYLLIWGGFSLAATALQWALDALHAISPAMMAVDGAGLAGAILILAGLYQFGPLKESCLKQCRSPARFLTEHHRPGRTGALLMGVAHGGYCLGCCWALMALLFVGGVMNLYWIAAIAGVVAVEKLSRQGTRFSQALGVTLIIAGLWVWYPSTAVNTNV